MMSSRSTSASGYLPSNQSSPPSGATLLSCLHRALFSMNLYMGSSSFVMLYASRMLSAVAFGRYVESMTISADFKRLWNSVAFVNLYQLEPSAAKLSKTDVSTKGVALAALM